MKRNIISTVLGLVLGLLVTAFAINHNSPTPVVVETKTSTDLVRTDSTAIIEEVTVDKVAESTTEEQTTELVSLGMFKLTAYCPCDKCSGPWGTQTSTGTTAIQGRTIAVDSNVIPYGTVVVINSQEYIAEDCGGAIDGNDIDIFFNSHKDALEFGVQYAEIFERR